MTWLPERDESAEREAFIAIYGEELWNKIQALSAPKPLASRVLGHSHSAKRPGSLKAVADE